MPDIKFIIENKQIVQDGLNKKGYTKEDLDLDELIGLHKKISLISFGSEIPNKSHNISTSPRSNSDFPFILAEKVLAEILIFRATSSCVYPLDTIFPRRRLQFTNLTAPFLSLCWDKYNISVSRCQVVFGTKYKNFLWLC